jgi:hypothetical protein
MTSEGSMMRSFARRAGFDLGVVVHEVVPKLTELLKQRKS